MKTYLPMLIVVTLSCTLLAQNTQQVQQVQRVDQAVGDLDALSHSMRQQGSGLRVDGEHTSLYVIPQEKIQQLQIFGQAAQSTGVQRTDAYLRIAPGIISQSDQSNYLVPTGRKEKKIDTNIASKVDGVFFETIPANTVFILSPQLQNLVHEGDQTQSSSYQGNLVLPRRVETRVASGMIDNRLDNRVQGQRVDNRVSGIPNQTLRYRVQEPQKTQQTADKQ